MLLILLLPFLRLLFVPFALGSCIAQTILLSQQDARSYFEVHGCKAEDEMGTAEHILDCISWAPIGDETDDDVHERMG
jgi:hypothetical protein